jgi:hypothetical protein
MRIERRGEITLLLWMSFAARLAKLESAHKRILRCPCCRFSLRETFPPTGKCQEIAPDSMLPTKCWYCGTRYGVPLRGLNEYGREAAELIYNSHPTKEFTDEAHSCCIHLDVVTPPGKERI